MQRHLYTCPHCGEYVQKSELLAEPKLIYDVGIRGDGPYIEYDKEVGKIVPAYNTWVAMLERCYSPKALAKRPTYVGVTVCEEWKNYQVFAKWYHENHPNDGERYQLDKDILIPGNRIYHPAGCKFVTQAENTIHAHAKHYRFRDPDGNLVEIYNLREFCKDKDLSQGHMSSVSTGKRPSHKGWTKYD